MRQRLAWLSTGPLMLFGLVAGHALGFRLAYSDPHARADALAQSGHGYFGYVPLALAVSLGVLGCGLVLQAVSGFRGAARAPVASRVLILLPPAAFVVQELTERLFHNGHLAWTMVAQPAFLLGLVLQLPFAFAALLLAWVLDSAARAVGIALGSAVPPSHYEICVPIPARAVAIPQASGLARGYGERAPPYLLDP